MGPPTAPSNESLQLTFSIANIYKFDNNDSY